MGIETIIGIAALAASVGGTGAEIAQSQSAASNAKDAQKKQEAAVRNQNAALQQQQTQADATAAARTARMRQRALLSGTQGNASTIATSPLGLAASPSDATSGAAPLLKTTGA